MEFVDAWGKPLQFFRWPILYRTTSSGASPTWRRSPRTSPTCTPGPYTSVYENREVDPLDPNQQLVAPAWWTTYNSGPGIFGGNGQRA
jgi:hypothetical protein